MALIPLIWNRLRILLTREQKKKLMFEYLSKKHLKKNKIFILLTMDLEYFNYPKNNGDASYEGFINYLDIIDSHKVPNTFFVEGKFGLDHRKDILKIFEEGHEIGSHGYGHINLGPYIWWNDIKSKNIESKRKSVSKNHEILINLTGNKPTCFRAPYFSIDLATIAILEKIGYRIDSSIDNVLFGLPTFPYRISSENLLDIGDSNIFEFCYTASHISHKKFHIDFQRIQFKTKDNPQNNFEIIKNCKNISPYFVVQMHPWDFSKKYYPNTDERLKFLSDFIFILKKRFDAKFLKMEDMLREIDKKKL